MLTLRDARTDALVAVAPTAGRLFRVHVCAGELRAAVIGDLIGRFAGLVYDSRVVITTLVAPDDAAAFNIHPAQIVPAVDSAQVLVDCPADRPADRGANHRADRPDDAGCHLLTGACSISPDVEALDPLALRLALLTTRYHAALEVGRPAIEDADGTLAAWRAALATWARSPGAPMAREPVRAIVAALDDDLDSPLALRVLHDLAADESVVPGAKFEVFAYADRLLGLDLARDIR